MIANEITNEKENLELSVNTTVRANMPMKLYSPLVLCMAHPGCKDKWNGITATFAQVFYSKEEIFKN